MGAARAGQNAVEWEKEGDSDTDFWIRLVGEEEDDPVARKRVKVAASGGQDGGGGDQLKILNEDGFVWLGWVVWTGCGSRVG